MAPTLEMGGMSIHITGNLDLVQSNGEGLADVRVPVNHLAEVQEASKQMQRGPKGYAISALPDNDGKIILNGRVIHIPVPIIASGVFVNKIRSHIRWLS